MSDTHAMDTDGRPACSTRARGQVVPDAQVTCFECRKKLEGRR